MSQNKSQKENEMKVETKMLYILYWKTQTHCEKTDTEIEHKIKSEKVKIESELI